MESTRTFIARVGAALGVPPKLEQSQAATGLVEDGAGASEKAIRELYEITSAHGLSFESRLRALLALGCRRFKLPIGLLTRVKGESLVFAFAHVPNTDIGEGMQLSLEKTFCSTTLASEGPICFEHAGASDWRAHPGYEALKLEAYLGTKITMGNHDYGTLCFAGPDPHPERFTEADTDFLQLMARWVQSEVERQRAEEVVHSIVLETSGVTGAEFFGQLVHSLAKQLLVRYACVAVPVGEMRSRVRSLAFWKGEGFEHDLEYDTAGTPCDHVLKGTAAFWPRDVQKHFPKDEDLVRLNVESYRAVPIKDASGKILGHVVVMDTKPMVEDPLAGSIMELVGLRAAGELQRLNAEKAFLQSDALKSALLTSVTHELRTPLAAIKASLATLSERNSRSSHEMKEELLQGVNQDIDYLDRLIENLLDMSRIEAGVMKPTCIWHPFEDLLESPLRRLEPQLRGRKLELDIPDDLPPVCVDGVQMHHVLMNLLDNAIKYSLNGSPIRVHARAKEKELEVRILTTGEVIPPEELTRIFDRFYRANTQRTPSIRGTGLGLAISRGLVEGHGGRIWAESNSSRNETTIAFVLPLNAFGELLRMLDRT